MAKSDRKTPFPAICPTKTPAPGPPDPGVGVLIQSTRPRKTGAAASTASMARFRGRRKTFLSSERKNRSQCRTGAEPGPAAVCGTSVTLAVDIEAFSGQLDEQVLQAGPHGLQAGHRDSGVDEFGVDLFRRMLAEGRADPPGTDGDVGQPELVEHVGRGGDLGRPDADPRDT